MERTVDAKSQSTFEPQYSSAVDLANNMRVQLPCMANQTWLEDPKRLLFMLSRYKQVASILRGAKDVLELGCGDGFGTSIVSQYVDKVYALDADPILITEAKKFSSRANIEFFEFVLGEPEKRIPGPNFYDGIYSLDVFEHIESQKSDSYASHVKAHLNPSGTFICGTPSKESQPYASERSIAGHINCLSGDEVKKFWEGHFSCVTVLSMNDEVLHTGYWPMSHYLLAICHGPL